MWFYWWTQDESIAITAIVARVLIGQRVLIEEED